MTNTSRTPKQEEAALRLRRALLSLADQESVVGVKAALALAQWDGVGVPSKVLEIINNMDNQKTAENL